MYPPIEQHVIIKKRVTGRIETYLKNSVEGKKVEKWYYKNDMYKTIVYHFSELRCVYVCDWGKWSKDI